MRHCGQVEVTEGGGGCGSHVHAPHMMWATSHTRRCWVLGLQWQRHSQRQQQQLHRDLSLPTVTAAPFSRFLSANHLPVQPYCSCLLTGLPSLPCFSPHFAPSPSPLSPPLSPPFLPALSPPATTPSPLCWWAWGTAPGRSCRASTTTSGAVTLTTFRSDPPLTHIPPSLPSLTFLSHVACRKTNTLQTLCTSPLHCTACRLTGISSLYDGFCVNQPVLGGGNPTAMANPVLPRPCVGAATTPWPL